MLNSFNCGIALQPLKLFIVSRILDRNSLTSLHHTNIKTLLTQNFAPKHDWASAFPTLCEHVN